MLVRLLPGFLPAAKYWIAKYTLQFAEYKCTAFLLAAIATFNTDEVMIRQFLACRADAGAGELLFAAAKECGVKRTLQFAQ